MKGGEWKTIRDNRRSGQVTMDFNGRTERRGGCVGDKRRGEEARSSMGAHERGGRVEDQKG
jgi:hypothetical protein